MAKLLCLLVTLSTLAYVSAHFISSLNIESTSTEGTEPAFATTLSQWIVETASRKIVAVARFFNLKLRLVRFLVSLWTTENLVLLRNVLEEAVRFGNLTVNFLPKSVEDPLYWWVPALSDFINVSVGDAGPVTIDESNEEPEPEVNEMTSNPPIFFNVPPSSTEKPTTNSNELDVRSKRLVMPIEEKAADQNDSEIEGGPYTKEEILQRYEENIITLDKLINAGRDN